MKRNLRNLATSLVLCIALCLIGCAGFMQLTPSASAKLDQFNEWAGKWVDGAKATMPRILAGASLIPGAQGYVALAGKVMTDADRAIAAYKASVEAVKQGAATPEEAALKQQKLMEAIERIKSVVGTIQSETKGEPVAS